MVRIRPIKRAQTLKDMAYDQVKDLLRSGQMSGETIYSANQLAGRLGVSRTPVREALLQLSAEGLLTALGSKGFRIRRFTRKEMEDTFDARTAIEGYVAARLAQQSGADLVPLDAIMQRMAKAADAGDTSAFMKADEAFHLHLVRALGNHVLQGVIEKIRDRILVLGHQALAGQGRMPDVVAEHQRIVDALKKHDATAAQRAMEGHMQATRERLSGETFAEDDDEDHSDPA